VRDFPREELYDTLRASAHMLRQGIEAHTGLIASIMQIETGEEAPAAPASAPALQARESRMREAIKEAIDVLDESRRAFKSRRLEELRKRLTQVLIDT
jgi:hypothetical protein